MVGLNLKGQHLNPLGLTHVVENAAQALGHPADQHLLAVFSNPDRVVSRLVDGIARALESKIHAHSIPHSLRVALPPRPEGRGFRAGEVL